MRVVSNKLRTDKEVLYLNTPRLKKCSQLVLLASLFFTLMACDEFLQNEAQTDIQSNRQGSTGASPFAKPDFASTKDNASVQIIVLRNDSSLEDKPVSVTFEDISTLRGSASIRNNRITYVPDGTFFGNDTFTYRVTDKDKDFSVASVTVDVICGTCADTVTLTLSWDANPIEEKVLGYNIYLEQSVGSAPKHLKAIGVNDSGFDFNTPSASFNAGQDLALKYGVRACFSITAYNFGGESRFSAPVCQTI